MPFETATLNRDCDVIQIPSGQVLKLPKGTEVQISQSLGGSFTVVTPGGYMVQITGKDADAIGKAAPKVPASSGGASESLEKKIWDQLKTCYDPEIPVNIVDLGLVYECKIKPTEDGKHIVEVKMTLTAPACGMGGPIAADARNKIESLPSVKEAKVDLVWEPVWDRSMMSEAAKLQLGIM